LQEYTYLDFFCGGFSSHWLNYFVIKRNSSTSNQQRRSGNSDKKSKVITRINERIYGEPAFILLSTEVGKY
jgi:hypothetical protein